MGDVSLRRYAGSMQKRADGVLKISGLAAVLLVTGCATTHLASERVAVVFGKPITYGMVETKTRAPTPVGGKVRIGLGGGQRIDESAARCGWSERDLELRRFRHFFLLFFRQGYISRIGSDETSHSFLPHSSRSFPRGTGFSAASFILAANANNERVVVVPRPDAGQWLINRFLYAKHNGRVSKSQGWMPVDGLRKEVELLERSGEIKFFDNGYRRRFWGYFDDLRDSDWAGLEEADEYFRAPWWTTPLPAGIDRRLSRAQLSSMASSLSCAPR